MHGTNIKIKNNSFDMFNTLYEAYGVLAINMYQITRRLIPLVRHLSIHLREQRKSVSFQATEAVWFDIFFLPRD
jgi:hypothetical protein